MTTDAPTMPTTPAEIRELALANLAARAAEGKALTDADWARLNALQADDQADPLGDLLGRIQASTEQLRAEGHRPTAAQLRLAREALLREIGAHVWPDVGAAAKELGVSVQTVRNWCDEAGITHKGNTAISRGDLYRALYQRLQSERIATGGKQPTDADAQEQHLRMLERQARIDERTGRHRDEALDLAREQIRAAVAALEHALATRLPAALAETLAADADRIAWEGRARSCIVEHLPALLEDLLAAYQSTNADNSAANHRPTPGPNAAHAAQE